MMRRFVKRFLNGHVGSRDPILEFQDPQISRERLKPETPNLERRLTAVRSKEKNAKLGQKGSRWGHVTVDIFFHIWRTTISLLENLINHSTDARFFLQEPDIKNLSSLPMSITSYEEIFESLGGNTFGDYSADKLKFKIKIQKIYIF